MQALAKEIIQKSGKQNSFVYKDKKLGPMLFYVVVNPDDNTTGSLYCSDWGRDWKFTQMERNGEQWLYRFENGEKVREYNLPKSFLEGVHQKTGIIIQIQ